MRKLNDNRRAEVEEIGRGNITNNTHNNTQLDISREQQQPSTPTPKMSTLPPPFNYTSTTAPPPPFGLPQGHMIVVPPQQGQQLLQQQGQGQQPLQFPTPHDGTNGAQGDGTKPSRAKICKKN